MSGRGFQVSRIYAIIQLLEGAPQGLTTREVHQRVEERGFKIEIRTVYRDLDALQAAGFPLYKDEDSDAEDRRWRLQGSAKVAGYFVLSGRELLALYLAREALAPLRDTPFYADLESAFHRIEEKLGKAHREHLDDLIQEVRFEPGPRWGLGLDPDVIDTVRAACSEGHLLKVVYESVSGGDTRERTLGPHYLYFARGSVYLVAEDLGDQQVKIFSLPRVKKAEMTDQAYTGKITDPEALFAGTFGVYRSGAPVTVRIHFSAKLSPFVRERRWHSSQTLVQLEGGQMEMRLEVGITPELVQWILSFGPEAKVVEPANLCTQIVDAAQGTIALYLHGLKSA